MGNININTENMTACTYDSKTVKKLIIDGETVWQKYTITFNANGGSCSTTTAQTNGLGKLVTLPEATRTDYVFDGWYTEQSGGTAVTTNYVFSADTTVYARWTVSVEWNRTWETELVSASSDTETVTFDGSDYTMYTGSSIARKVSETSLADAKAGSTKNYAFLSSDGTMSVFLYEYESLAIRILADVVAEELPSQFFIVGMDLRFSKPIQVRNGFRVCMDESGDTSFIPDADNSHVVYDGNVTVDDDNVMHLEFTEPYQYAGGNLGILLENHTYSTYTSACNMYPQVTFYLQVEELPSEPSKYVQVTSQDQLTGGARVLLGTYDDSGDFYILSRNNATNANFREGIIQPAPIDGIVIPEDPDGDAAFEWTLGISGDNSYTFLSTDGYYLKSHTSSYLTLGSDLAESSYWQLSSNESSLFRIQNNYQNTKYIALNYSQNRFQVATTNQSSSCGLDILIFVEEGSYVEPEEPVGPETFYNLAELNALADGTEFQFDGNCYVQYVSGNYVLLRDDTAFATVYMSTLPGELTTVGQTITGFTGKIRYYSGSVQLTNISNIETNGTIVVSSTPVELYSVSDLTSPGYYTANPVYCEDSDEDYYAITLNGDILLFIPKIDGNWEINPGDDMIIAFYYMYHSTQYPAPFQMDTNANQTRVVIAELQSNNAGGGGDNPDLPEPSYETVTIDCDGSGGYFDTDDDALYYEFYSPVSACLKKSDTSLAHAKSRSGYISTLISSESNLTICYNEFESLAWFISADAIADCVWRNIVGIDLHLTSNVTSNKIFPSRLYIGESETACNEVDTMDNFWEGNLPLDGSGIIHIEFNDPYQYTGSNLTLILDSEHKNEWQSINIIGKITLYLE